MELYAFDHGRDIKPGCCGWRCSVTYWMADTRTHARQEITEETPDSSEPHGLCANCLADMLDAGPYEIRRVEP